MPEIAYLETPSTFLNNLFTPKETKEILKMLKYYDYAGGIKISENSFNKQLDKFPNRIKKYLESISNKNNGTTYLRSKKYYLNIIEKDNLDKVLPLMTKYLNEVSEVIMDINSDYADTLESKLLLSSILDHKKHYDMAIFNSFFFHMLDKELDLSLYEEAKNNCVKDISNYYQFLLTQELGEQSSFSEEIIDIFQKRIIFPKAKDPTEFKPEGEPAARKMLIREMDHPMQILLFAGQLLRQDKTDMIDFVVNPLYGALEIGYALKSIYSIKNIEKINNIFLIKYSRYGEDDSPSTIKKYIPQQIIGETNELIGKRIMVVDDNVFSGNTLFDIKEMLKEYSGNIEVAAIERITDMEVERKINYDELAIKPVSKLRYIERVLKNVVRNNLNGLL